MPITIDKPNQYFDTSLWSGTGATQSISSLNFQPDWLWVKSRSTASNHRSQNSVTGVTKGLNPNENVAETTLTDCVTSFNSNGFTLGADSQGYVNTSSRTYVGWSWKANGTGVSNTDGTISSTVSVNTTSGFSIVSYTGNGTTGATIGHGLGVVPKIMIVKRRTGVSDWRFYHSYLGSTYHLEMNDTGGATLSSISWNNTSPTSSVFTVGSSGAVNNSGDTFIAYCFAEVKGFSKFGSYTGNASNDGTFVYTGFKPAFVLMKRTGIADNWLMKDSVRDSYNVADKRIYPNSSSAEDTSVNGAIDLLSNGFKHRSSNDMVNPVSEVCIYMAFASSPFVSSKGIPTTAR